MSTGVRVALMIGMNKVLYVNGFYLFVLFVYSGKRTDWSQIWSLISQQHNQWRNFAGQVRKFGLQRVTLFEIERLFNTHEHIHADILS